MSAFWEANGETEFGRQSRDSNKSGTSTKRLKLTQEGLDKIVQDILGSEQGLAQLVQGQSTAGLYGSSTNTLMAQNMVTNLAGELAKLTAETEESFRTYEKTIDKSAKQKAGGKVGTVVCTELVRLGYLPEELYEAGNAYFMAASPQMVRGYRVWANKIVPLMESRPWLCKFLNVIAVARYLHITHREKSFLGALSVWVVEPACYLIGFFVPQESKYGYEALER